MSRTNWKGPYIEVYLRKNQEIKTFNRNSLITPKFINYVFKIHNGKNFLKLKVNENMLWHKLGEFSPTRKSFSFKKRKKTK